ncbi:MAG: 50S ribosome-binding GTPase, partial [Clostridia bacterium]|nr:50S ribosome-binding GTPase [Clostridia bacterium]
MSKIHIVGNPNSGKTTLFNSITKSSEHVGNWHGVTVDKVSKLIKFKDKNYELIDLPGLYSFNAFSLEEQISIDEINSSDCKNILYLLDANNFKRGLLLALTLLINNKNIKILINNYKNFTKNNAKIDVRY